MAKSYGHKVDPKTGKPYVVKELSKKEVKRKGSLDEPMVIKDGPLRIFRKKK